MNMENDSMKDVYDLLDKFTEISKKLAFKHPYLVVIAMHEYFRNIWPNDPIIEEKLADDKLESIILCLKNCLNLLSSAEKIGSYFTSKELLTKFKNLDEKGEKDHSQTQTVYGKLWKSLDDNYLIQDTKNILINLFEQNGMNVNILKDKKVLDMGCGSGRFTIALAQLGVKNVIGVDLGEGGIKIGEKQSKDLDLKNIQFMKESVLSLPFEDETFDFVFSKGVLHHTGQLENGLEEFHRVLKPGGNGFLYLYGSGGLFWNSRKKMREVMKDIPMNYTLGVLDTIGMPSQRYIFADSWYVPIEEHVERKWLEEFLLNKFSKITKVENSGESTIQSMSNLPYSNELWGDGELRYFLTK